MQPDYTAIAVFFVSFFMKACLHCLEYTRIDVEPTSVVLQACIRVYRKPSSFPSPLNPFSIYDNNSIGTAGYIAASIFL